MRKKTYIYVFKKDMKYLQIVHINCNKKVLFSLLCTV